METTDLTIEILKSIRDEIRLTREDLGGRMDATKARIDETNKRLVETEIRLATEIVGVASAIDTLTKSG